jgi:arabinofuranan 3-O-arabinosyltransferase
MTLDKPPEMAAPPRVMLLACLLLVATNVATFPVHALMGEWILDARGKGIPVDFVNVWAAGKMALDGQAALAYDWYAHKQVQVAALGQDFQGYFGWHYPPPFLLVAALLAKLPYTVAFALWSLLSLLPYLLVIRCLVGHPFGWMVGAGFPTALYNAIVGQNGFLTTALFGGTLKLLPLRPVLAGVCLGLLTYKPQYGLLFPLALIAGRHWVTFFVAAGVAVGLAALSFLVFGIGAWIAFFEWAPRASQSFLSDGFAEFRKMQSLYTLGRFAGFAEPLAWTLHVALAVVAGAATVLLWRSRATYELKAAALAAASLLVTPYLYMYDLVLLSIPVALLIRLGLQDGFRAHELPALGVAVLLLLAFPFVIVPTGFVATLIVAGLVAIRAWENLAGAAPAVPLSFSGRKLPASETRSLAC